jgi:hypothetical protein
LPLIIACESQASMPGSSERPLRARSSHPDRGAIGFTTVCYLYALDIDEASFVTPLYQTVPIFAYFLGYFILSETITLAQGLGSFVIIVGALHCRLSLVGGEFGSSETLWH